MVLAVPAQPMRPDNLMYFVVVVIYFLFISEWKTSYLVQFMKCARSDPNLHNKKYGQLLNILREQRINLSLQKH